MSQLPVAALPRPTVGVAPAAVGTADGRTVGVTANVGKGIRVASGTSVG
jgi:hypothetical protein